MDVQKNRVLIVDDDTTVADTTALIFSREGYDAKAAYSAEQALVLIREWHPTAAILDIILPQMNGIALARLMRLACPDCWVALFSSQDFTGELFRSVPADLPFISKPVDPHNLVTFVGNSLRARRVYRGFA